ncbi:MAG: thioredoxin family protein [Bacteroidales bacterium]|nr:thioredoxin family protein [Bacteroidales bacterium]
MTNNHTTCTEDTNMITGKTNLEQLSQNVEFWSEYLIHYASYNLDKEKVENISTRLDNRIIHIVAVLGTWCGDTKEQLPVLQKILDNLSDNNISIEYIGVNRDKLAGETDISSLGIIFVPTFIFYEDNKELGRIVEIPEGTMEEHIYEVINNK